LLGLSAGVVAALACDQAKNQGANASTASAGATCSAARCPYGAGAKGASAATISASFDHCSGKTGASATTASTAGMANGACSGKGAVTSATMANGACGGHSASATAVTASNAGGACAAHGASATTTAMAAGADHVCGGEGATAAMHHADCTYCQDMDACEKEMHSLGAVTQVVPLKNGVMYVYTVDPARVRAVQAAMARRKDTTAQFASTGEDAHLCSSCRALRGAAASGKLTREVVNIDGGCLTLMTSNDPAVVARIHELAGVSTNRVKS
jgi:hypothetical protein